MTVSTLKIMDDKAVDIGVREKQRADVAEKLSGFLASTYTLYMKALYYHWNVTGVQFHSLHSLFEQQYEGLHKTGDELAERIRALGHFTPGTFKAYMDLSSVDEDDALPDDAKQMVENLLRDNETCSKEAREVLRVAEDSGDEVTVDMMVARMAAHDEAAWMLRSTIQ
ncbi:Dps family protein [uncultured Kiloniella sp.]|uniref:Dps family protein n=1 Tax=Kiloniella sp. TaxID=1938587 RepID=UPI002606E4EE|nr:Dps family protein [uncultured Kiloniella sp.]